MKRGITVLSVAVALVGAFALGRAGAQEGTAEMAEWMALAKPGPEHAKLLKSIGTWNCECKCWGDPAGEPKITKGKAIRSEALGGRFVREEFEGEMMGSPFQGIGYIGFNNATRKHEIAWIDSMGTGILLLTGTETAPGTRTFTGSLYGPGGKEVKTRSVVKEIGPDECVMEMYNDEGSGESKCMELTYTRAK